MKFLIENSNNYGYHYGPLVKKDTRASMTSNRNTGYLGTGYYFYGKTNEEKDYGYIGSTSKPIIIDFSQYNLFKPRSNNECHSFIEALKILNRFGHSWILDILKIKKTERELEIELSDLEWEKGNEGIIEFINKYDPNYNLVDRYNLKQAIEEDLGDWLKDAAKDIITFITDIKESFKNSIFKLSFILDTDIRHIWSTFNNAIKNITTDSITTVIMKSLGYQGVDVRHLSEYDNNRWGSVIYDIKPHTIIKQ